MYLDTHDYETVWRLAHNWCGLDPSLSDEENLPEDIRLYISRILIAVKNRKITIRNKKMQIFYEESLTDFILDFKHHLKLNRCLTKDIYIKDYLNSLYVKRPEVLSWCLNDFLEPPPKWRTDKFSTIQMPAPYDATEDENSGWYESITDFRKKRVACLEIAKKLWLIHQDKSYDEIYNDPVMKQYGNPSVFSLDAFKKWARPFAPDGIKEGGRPKKNKQL